MAIRSTEDLAASLVAVMADGLPHSNAEIHIRTGLKWDDCRLPRVRKYLRNHGKPLVCLQPGYWQMTTQGTLHAHDHRRTDRARYSYVITMVRKLKGAMMLDPTDITLKHEHDAKESEAVDLGHQLGYSLAEVLADLEPFA